MTNVLVHPLEVPQLSGFLGDRILGMDNDLLLASADNREDMKVGPDFQGGT